jgi:hypothetical protein
MSKTEPTEVYIIVSGEYSDYRIDAVFLDKTAAEEYVAQNPDASIETRQIGCDMLPEGTRVYRVRMDENGDTADDGMGGVEVVGADRRLSEDSFESDYPRDEYGRYDCSKYVYSGVRRFYVTTKHGEQGALKIANERRRQLVAENQWPAKGSEVK